MTEDVEGSRYSLPTLVSVWFRCEGRPIELDELTVSPDEDDIVWSASVDDAILARYSRREREKSRIVLAQLFEDLINARFIMNNNMILLF